MRKLILQSLYRLFPFNLQGDCLVPEVNVALRISCVINFYGRLDLLQGILCSLAEQEYPKDQFEVVLVEDKGGTDAGRQMAADFSGLLQIVYLPLDANFGKMGYSRNFGLSRTKGDIILFLDDDTIILQQNFLSTLDFLFTKNNSADALVPFGQATYACLNDRYNFHDSYFMTSRCTAYRRKVLQELGGFMSCFVGQEDVEFVTRFTIADKIAVTSDALNYYHPPLLVPNIRKPRAVGFSFYGLKERYSLLIWLLLLVNCARHAPLFFLPIRRFREQGRFGIGFICGIVDGIRGSKEQVYG
jgi:glycosyltransferase involved in cell wall biosynthesis